MFRFNLLTQYENVVHGVFNRHGGSSSSPYNSLNVSFGVGDNTAHVHSNRQTIKDRLQTDILVSSEQVHAAEILVVDTHSSHCSKDQPPENHSADTSGITRDLFTGYDAFITHMPGTSLMVQQADCQAIMLLEPHKNIIANIHCGWRGSVANIIGKTIDTLIARFNVSPHHLIAGISPSLGPCCAEFVHFQQELPPSFHKHQVKPAYFDFWAISRDQLCSAGVKETNIETASICTVCNTDWFSYRREKKTGRFCSVIGLR